jgi:pimeloyl-ACP methyl ester carboxylesterase
MKRILLLAIVPLFIAASCRKPKDDPAPGVPGTGGGQPCNTSYLPIVMCHGMLASGDTYARQVQRFVQNGQCNDRIFVFDWNTLGGGSSVPGLDAYIDQILQQTGAQQVELVGHSAGGGLGYDYLNDAARAAKVAHYVHIGSGAQAGPAGPDGSVPTLNIWSPYDAIVSGGDIPGAVNLQLEGKDHYEVATSAASFAAMYSFFRGSEPANTGLVSDGRRYVAGRVLTLGENQPLSNATVNVFRVESSTGARINEQPDHVHSTDANGNWGGFEAAQGAYYEFEVTPPAGRKLHYYREPFITSDRLVYLRSLPPPSSLAGILLSSLPSDDAQAVVVSFTSNQAVIAGRDELHVNGIELSTPAFASEENSTIAYFLFDGNNDSQTNGTSVGLFGNFPFLSGVDVFFPTTTPETIELTFAGRSLRVRNWPSASEGITLAIFD